MDRLEEINQQVVRCRSCPRLVVHRQDIAKKKVRRFIDWDYWGKPVPGFGVPDPRLLIIGLAPGAHGSNRTGRMFTGDASGDWLYRAMHLTGFATQSESTSREDGLELIESYITAIVRCVPPHNKPSTEEIKTCSKFFHRELQVASNVVVILCLGAMAFKQFCKYEDLSGLAFSHGALYDISRGRKLIVSYHPSRQNTNTGKLKWDEWLKVFKDIRQILS